MQIYDPCRPRENAALQQRDMDRLFYAIQNLLNAAANVSKALWGSGGKLAVGRQPLREGSSVIETRLVKTAKQNFGSCQAIPNSALSV